MRRRLFEVFLRKYPFQPATAFWRAVEIAEVLEQDPLVGTVLDLGCGDGKLTAILNENWRGQRKWIGLEPDPLEASAAEAAGLYERILREPGNAIPLVAGSVDAVFSNSVLEHIPDVDPVLGEVARVMKCGGRFLFTVPSTGFHASLRGPLLGGPRDKYLHSLDRRLAHFYYLDEEGWKEKLGRFGMRMSCARRFLTGSQTRRWETLSRMTGGALYAMTGSSLRPIEIQRTLGVRTGRERLPKNLSALLAGVLAGPLEESPDAADPCGCLLIEATRVGA